MVKLNTNTGVYSAIGHAASLAYVRDAAIYRIDSNKTNVLLSLLPRIMQFEELGKLFQYDIELEKTDFVLYTERSVDLMWEIGYSLAERLTWKFFKLADIRHAYGRLSTSNGIDLATWSIRDGWTPLHAEGEFERIYQEGQA